MNILAEEANKIIENTIAFKLLSKHGKRFYFPSKGIVSQSAEAKAKAHKYNATIGMAFSDGEPIILSSVSKYLKNLTPTESVSYAPTGGDPNLRKLWKEEMSQKNQDLDTSKISDPVVVTGLTNGIAQIADLFINNNENIVIPDMFWGNYRLIFEGKRKANIIEFPFFTEDMKFNVKGFKETLKSSAVDKKIATILNFPNNPTGYTPTIEEANEIANSIKELADEDYEILVLCDDAYFGMFYEKDTFTQSIFAKLYNLHENILAVKIDGATKEDYVWGFRIGFVTFGSKSLQNDHYKVLNDKLMGSLRASISNSSRLGQTILAKALKDAEYKTQKTTFLKDLNDRYNTVKEILATRTNGSKLKELSFNSGYFMSFIVEGASAEDLRIKLLNDEGIGTISIKDKYLRIAYASVDLKDLKDLYKTIFETADKL